MFSRLSGSPLVILAAALVGGALTIVAFGGLGWVVFVGLEAAQVPDPSVVDGDPCCGHPDTWRDVGSGLGFAAMLAVGEALILSAGVGLLAWSGKGRGVGPRFVMRATAAMLGGLVVVSAISFGADALARTPTACSTVVHRAAEWLSSVDEIHRCGGRRLPDR